MALQKHSLFQDKIIPGNPCLIIRYASIYTYTDNNVNTLLDIQEKAKLHRELNKIPNEEGDDAKSCFSRRYRLD